VTWEKTFIFLDDCSIHKSEKVISFCRQMGFSLMFLPAYSTVLAPVEMYFSQIKSFIKKEYSLRNYRLESASGLEAIRQAVGTRVEAFMTRFWQWIIGILV
jgi:transposase